MGSQSKRKKGTKDQRNTITDIKRQIDQDAARTALQPSLEVDYSPAGVGLPEIIRVTDNLDLSNQTRTAPFNTTTLNLWLKLNGNYNDYSNEKNPVYAHISQRNKAFMTPGKFGAHAANLNWPSYPVAHQGDCIIIPDSTPVQLDFTNGFSYSMWIYPRAPAGSNPSRLIQKRTDSSNHFQLIFDDFRLLHSQVTEAGTPRRRTHVTPVTLNTWSHVVFTDTGSASEIYLNKIAGSAGSVDLGAPSSLATYLVFGMLMPTGAGDYGFRGGMDEIMYIKGAALNQTQVNSLFDNNSF